MLILSRDPIVTNLICHQLIRIVQTLFLECSFIYTAPCEWNKLSEYIFIHSGRVFKQCYLYGCSVKIIDLLLLFRL